MSELISIKTKNKKNGYDVLIEKGFSKIKNKLDELEVGALKCLIVTDSNVAPLYGQKVTDILKESFADVLLFTFEAGEENKNFDTVSSIIAYLSDNKFNRNDYIVALGGGVVGDTVGFAASIFKRGINFIQMPTTLLADVDSSIGGKTGVDVNGYKNMIGSFYMPKFVYISINALNTLTARQYYSGMAEVMKYGLIMDSDFYEWILDNMYNIFDLNKSTLEEMIAKCVSLKQKVVEEDTFEETGLRQILNFGHTIGHAIEKFKNFTMYHGECVALGCVAAAYISWQRKMISMDDYYEIRDMFVPFNLPITVTELNVDEILEIIKTDKKADENGVNFVLLKKVGKAMSGVIVSKEEIIESIDQIHFTEDDEKE